MNFNSLYGHVSEISIVFSIYCRLWVSTTVARRMEPRRRPGKFGYFSGRLWNQRFLSKAWRWHLRYLQEVRAKNIQIFLKTHHHLRNTLNYYRVSCFLLVLLRRARIEFLMILDVEHVEMVWNFDFVTLVWGFIFDF